MFITFEGPDGAGKTTQINMLKDWFAEQKMDAVFTREPGGTEIGNQIREVIMNMKNKSMSPRAEILLFCASRAQLVEELIRPSLREGKIVVCDRYADSTMAYQGYGHGLDKEELSRLMFFATGGLKPDLTILLNLRAEEGLKRRLSNHEEWNRMDDYALNFHKRVQEGYQQMALSEPQRWEIVDAAPDPLTVQGEIRKRILNHIERL